jgi:hypothetical protein
MNNQSEGSVQRRQWDAELDDLDIHRLSSAHVEEERESEGGRSKAETSQITTNFDCILDCISTEPSDKDDRRLGDVAAVNSDVMCHADLVTGDGLPEWNKQLAVKDLPVEVIGFFRIALPSLISIVA